MNKIKLFFKSLIFGLKGGEDLIENSNIEDIGSPQKEITMQQDSMYNYYKKQENRYEFYRVLRESEKYHTDIEIVGDINSNDYQISGKAVKKTPLDYVCKIEVYNPEKLPLYLIQENKLVLTKSNFDGEEVVSTFLSNDKDYVSIFNIERGEFRPRFKLEDYIKKIVFRIINDKEYYIDMYSSIYASQFGKIDAIFVSQLKKLFDTKDKKSDITDIKSLGFTTDKAFGVDDHHTLKFENLKYEDINIFDGNYVLTFKGTKEIDIDIVEQYKVDSMEEKFKNKAPREGKDIDLFTIMRNINKENNKEDEIELSKTTLKLK